MYVSTYLSSPLARVSICKTFAEQNAKIFFRCASVLREKQQFAQSFAKVISRKDALFCFCATRVLLNSAISLKSYVCISWNWKVLADFWILEKSCFDHFYIFYQWQSRLVRMSWGPTLFIPLLPNCLTNCLHNFLQTRLD